MKRSKKLYTLLGVLAVVLAATVAVLTYEEKKEEIKNSDEVILEIAKDDVTGISWEYSTNSLAFYKEENWMYDGDDTFPVDGDKLTGLLGCFEALEASFTIENVEDYDQYGLENPECSIILETEEKTYEILLGDFSNMDSQRYVSIGDGNVYLVADDPAEDFDVALSDLIAHDEIPDIADATEIAFAGTENYRIVLGETSFTYDEEDLYYVEQNGVKQALDTENVESWLEAVESIGLTDYKTYNATEEELSEYGLLEPEMTITVKHPEEDEDGETPTETFTISIGRNPEEVEKADEDDEVAAFVRIGESKIIYEITSTKYDTLMAVSYDDLRHQQIFWADFASVTELQITLDGENYAIAVEGKEDERVYKYEDEEIEIADIKSGLVGVTADSFTVEEMDGKEEIKISMKLDNENVSNIDIAFYRHDGSSCLAVVDGEPVAFVERAQVVELIEAVNAVILK